MTVRLASAIVVLAVSAIAAAGQRGQRVLFVGNSLTFSNGLPAMVEALGAAAGGPAVETTMMAQPNVSLEEHWARGEAQRALSTGRWSMVVLQQGPSSRADSQHLLREYVVKFALEAQRHGTKVGLYMVWPPRSGPGTFAQVHDSYTRAARDVKGTLLPVGDAFQEAMRLDPQIALFGPDGFHPSPLGTFLAAIVIHQQLSGRAEPFVPASLEPRAGRFPRIEVGDAMRGVLRAAAAAAVTQLAQPGQSK